MVAVKHLSLVQNEPVNEELERKVADTDDGFIMLAMTLYEELIGANLTRNQAKVAHAVCRKTYGFKKKMDRIADSQLAEICRISRPKANIAKNELISMKVLVKDGGKIGPNKNISEWCIPDCSQIDNIVTKSGTNNVTKPVTQSVTKTEHTKDIIQNIKDKEPTIPPKGGSGDTSLREELIELLEGKFDFDKASTLHDAVEAEIIASGYECFREFRVADRGDGRPGRVDLLVSNADGDVCGIEIDRINVRDKSVVKIKQLSDGFILVREGIVSERYELHGVPVISAHPLASACNGITRDEAMEKATAALNFYNELSSSQCRDVKPFMTLLTPTQTRGSYTFDEICTVIEWVLSTWKMRSGNLPKPTNICRVNRFDGYLSDALRWKEGADRNPDPCPHEKLIQLWNGKFPERAVELHEWNKSRPAYRGMERVWNGKTNSGAWREEKHIATVFDLIRKSRLCDGLHDKPWLTLDWILDAKNWAKVYEQARREYKLSVQGVTQ